MTLKLNSEVFLIQDGESYIVYAPLRFIILKVSPQQVNLLVRLKRGRPRKEDADTDLVKSLMKAGIIDGKPESKLPTCVGKSYAPTSATLFLTSRCNLACVYCYAGRQTRDLVMPLKIGMAAIDYIAENCKARNRRELKIGFHGGGEPTMAWKELQSLTEYAKSVAKENGLELQSGIATNGCLSAEKAQWLADNLSYVNISLDGPPRIQDRQRPMKNGKRSSKMIRRTMQILEAVGTPYGIQATVTKDTVHEMPAIVRYFSRYAKPNIVKFEPVGACGRYFGHECNIPLDKQFAHFFNKAYEVGVKLGLNVSFSAVRGFENSVSVFCGAFAEPFVVTPDGYVSACYEAYSTEAPYADTFIFGYFDVDTQKFVLDLKKLEELRRRNVYTLRRCRNCFCKFSCGGDCAARAFRRAGMVDLTLAGARCQAIRAITQHRLKSILESAIA